MDRPKSAPVRIPDWAWALRAWHKNGRRDPRPEIAPDRVPAWYWLWYAWRSWSDKHPDAPQPPKPVPPTVDPALTKARQLLAECRKFTGRYIYGGGHGPQLSALTYSQGLDCSSSTSKALRDVGLFPESSVAQVSGWFEHWGDAGSGRYITIHANYEHVWIQFSLPEGYFRFDTSPHGDGPSGPRVRTKERFTSTFVARHPHGL